MTPHTHDDGFHEIQLNGKQLVFLFMAATVASVCIFLCGVFVGRGVRAERPGSAGEVAGLTAVASAPAEENAPRGVVPPPASASGEDPTKASPPPQLDGDLSYFDRLEKSGAAREELKAEPTAPPSGSSQVRGSAAPKVSKAQKVQKDNRLSEAAPPPAPALARSPALVGGTGPGYTVQIAAMNVRDEADAMAKRLSERGYEAYVLEPLQGMPQVFRVRVGKFPTIHDAETMKSKLEKEEHFKPWITR